jgi:peptidoglycan/LPS O-acetylase OafA/YrhL
MSYAKFAAMIATSTIVMFGLMYLNTFALDHIYWSQTRGWMALLMGAVMAAIMLLFMLKMYKNKSANIAILIGAVVIFAGSLWLVRSQTTVGDIDYMKAMIPHHSIAILTSSRAHIKDPRVRELADSIIEAQVREIAEMQRLVADLEANPIPADAPDLPPTASTQ